MSKKKNTPTGEDLYCRLLAMPEDEQDVFWQAVAHSDVWQGTFFEEVVGRFLQQVQQTAANTWRKGTQEEKDKFEQDLLKEMIKTTDPFREVVIRMALLRFYCERWHEQQPILRDAVFGMMEDASRFTKKRSDHIVELEKDICELMASGIEKPKDLWRALKATGKYPELDQKKVRKHKSVLKKAGKLPEKRSGSNGAQNK